MKSTRAALFAAGVFLVTVFFGLSYVQVLEQNRRHGAKLLLTSRVQSQMQILSGALFRAQAPLFSLADILAVHRGDIADFEKHAAHLLDENSLVRALMLVPDGVVRQAYPLAGNEAAIGHDLLQDPARRTEVLEAIATNSVVLAGPVVMRQGGVGLFARKPVYWIENGQQRLWGLVAALIPWERILETFDFAQLEQEGYAYRLSRKLRTDQAAVIIAASTAQIRDEVSVRKSLAIPGGEWELVLSAGPSARDRLVLVGNLSALVLALIIAALTFHVVRGRQELASRAEDLRTLNAGLQDEIAWRKSMEEDLRRAKEGAEQATRAKSEFLATMSHEIRTPMNGVHGMLQLMYMTPLDQEQKDYVDTARQALGNLLELINDILDFSKIEAGKLELRPVRVVVRELCRSLPDIFKEQLLTKGLSLDVDIDAGVPVAVLADGSRIRQALLNLVGNAVKFTDSGGIRIAISFSCPSAEQAFLHFCIVDTGIGISPRQLGRLFKPFVQGEQELVRSEKGTGLGLSIVKQLAELMGGAVELDSAPGQGTTARLHVRVGVLPDDEGQDRGRSDDRDSPLVRSGMTILLAEDDPTNRMMMTRLLEKSGCVVIQAENGQEAVEMVAQKDVDLILMDIQMPIMDGVEATRRIRAASELGVKSRVPVVAVTAFAMSGDRERFLAAGMDDYLPKPVNIKELRSVLDRLGTRA